MPLLQQFVQPLGLIVSFAAPVQPPPDADCSPLSPRPPATSIAYHMHAERRGTQEPGIVDTTLTLSPTSSDVTVVSTAPALSGKAVAQPDGSLDVQGNLLNVIDPYNQLATSLHCTPGAASTGESTLRIMIGNNKVIVPVKVETTDDGGRVAVAIAGATDTSIRGARAHVVVNVHATIMQGRLVSASGDNNITASIPFRKIHVEQLWSLDRVQ